jgi:hypothetical protein
MSEKNSYLNPYISGVLIGLVLLLFYGIVGVEFNGSASALEVVSEVYGVINSNLVSNSEFFTELGLGKGFTYVSMLAFGLFVGGFISSLANGRINLTVERGGDFSSIIRLFLTMMGGLIVGFSAQLGRGDLLDNLFGGSVVLSTGSLIFVIMALLGSYMFAFLFWRQWSD